MILTEKGGGGLDYYVFNKYATTFVKSTFLCVFLGFRVRESVQHVILQAIQVRLFYGK